MASMIRNIAGGVTGVAVAIGTVALTEVSGRAIGILPAPPASSSAEAMSSHIQSLPPSALLFVAGGWFLAVLLGSYVAVRVGRDHPRFFPLLVGGAILLAAAANFVLLPHPMWFVAVGILAIVLATVLAMQLTGRAMRNPYMRAPLRHVD